MITAEELARLFHETYERLAPEFGYETRPESATGWDQVPDNNKHLLVATAEVVLTELADKHGVQFPMPPVPEPRHGRDPEDDPWSRNYFEREL